MSSHQHHLDKLAEIAALSDDVRFGQLLANIGLLAEDRTDHSLWDVEDDQLLEVMEGHRSDLVARSPSQAVNQTATTAGRN